ncbi:hypothetical protein E2C01_043837 [Portunus trituberculatus]|uniref:Uncharacterized protein n=1 Tax=Portunus trituberculatus TaxID=210409 RepID=A0A5B7FYS0_PORTR|nr:hypothetical protein [Portunus trituberculatus]
MKQRDVEDDKESITAHLYCSEASHDLSIKHSSLLRRLLPVSSPPLPAVLPARHRVSCAAGGGRSRGSGNWPSG